MPFSRRQLRAFQLFVDTVRLEESVQTELVESLPKWHKCVESFNYKFESLVEKSLLEWQQVKEYSQLLLELRNATNQSLKHQDIAQFIKEYVLVYLCTEGSNRAFVAGAPHAGHLGKFAEKYIISQLPDELKNIANDFARKVSSLLTNGQQYYFWFFHLQQVNDKHIIIETNALRQLSHLMLYMLKSRLSIDRKSTDFFQLIYSPDHIGWSKLMVETPKPERDGSNKTFVVNTNLTNHLLQYGFLTKSGSYFDPYWRDIIFKDSYRQPSLFDQQLNTSALLDYAMDTGFSSVFVDLLNTSYKRKLKKSQISGLVTEYQVETAKGVDYPALVIAWMRKHTHSQSLFVMLLPDSFLHSSKVVYLREYLAIKYYQIYLVHNLDEGWCAAYMLSNAPDKSKNDCRIFYSRTSSTKVGSKVYDFDEIDWTSIPTDERTHWVGIADKAYSSWLSLYGNSTSIFITSTKAQPYALPQYLIDIDKKVLSNKLSSKREFLESKNNTSGSAQEKLNRSELLLQQVTAWPTLDTYAYTGPHLAKKDLSHSILILPGTGEVLASDRPVINSFKHGFEVLPIYHNSLNEVNNISKDAIKHLRKHYRSIVEGYADQVTNPLAENTVGIIKKLNEYTQDLPILSKYPKQLEKLLNRSDVTIGNADYIPTFYSILKEFKLKVNKLLRNAVERKVIYQRVGEQINDFIRIVEDVNNNYLSASSNLKSITELNVVHYIYAVLHDPKYKRKYSEYLQWEVPRIPLYTHFLAWATLGKELYDIHTRQTELSSFMLQAEVIDNKSAKSVSYSYKVFLDKGEVKITKGEQICHISGIPPEAFNYRVKGISPIVHMLEYWKVTAINSGKKNTSNGLEISLDLMIEKLSEQTAYAIASSAVIVKIEKLENEV